MKRSNRWEIGLTILVLLLSIVVTYIGVSFCYTGTMRIASVGDVDVNIMLRSPSEYMMSKRDVAMSGLEILIPGVVLVLLGVIAITIAVTRGLSYAHEGRAISRLETRVEKLEKELKEKKTKK